MAGTEESKKSRTDDDDACTRVSTYSYQSERDAAKFLRQADGRVSDYLLLQRHFIWIINQIG